MNSAWYGLAMLAILVVVHWVIMNDKLPDGQTKGIFAMKLASQSAAARKAARRRGKFKLPNQPGS